MSPLNDVPSSESLPLFVPADHLQLSRIQCAAWFGFVDNVEALRNSPPVSSDSDVEKTPDQIMMPGIPEKHQLGQSVYQEAIRAPPNHCVRSKLFFPRVRTPCGHGAQVIVEGREEKTDGGERNEDPKNQPKNQTPRPAGRLHHLVIFPIH